MAEDIETTLQHHWATRHVDFEKTYFLAKLIFLYKLFWYRIDCIKIFYAQKLTKLWYALYGSCDT